MNFSIEKKNGIDKLWQPNIIAAVLATFVLAACSSSDSDPDPDSNTGTSTMTSTNTNTGTDTGMNTDTNTDLDIDLDTASGSDTNVKFPSAANDSGPESLIVTGFDDSNRDATSPWLVHAYFFKLNSELTTSDARIDLVKYPDDFPVLQHAEFYETELEQCEVNDPDATSNDGSDGGGQNEPPPSISGGSSVVINTPSGPWFTINRSIEGGQSRYTVGNELPAELLPAGATLSIPGDVFPTVAAHPLFEPAPPVRLLPIVDEPVSTESEYSWLPADGKNYMRIAVIAFDADNNFVDFVVTCDVKDDGQFTMPAEVINFVSTTPFRLAVRYERVYHRVDFVNGIVVRQFSSIGE